METSNKMKVKQSNEVDLVVDKIYATYKSSSNLVQCNYYGVQVFFKLIFYEQIDTNLYCFGGASTMISVFYFVDSNSMIE